MQLPGNDGVVLKSIGREVEKKFPVGASKHGQSGWNVLPLRLAKKHPLFHVDAFWSRFKICFHLKNCLCAVPIFGNSCAANVQDDHVFKILAFRSLSFQ